MDSYSHKLKFKNPPMTEELKRYLENRNKPQYTYKDFKPYGKLKSCFQAAQEGKTIHVDSFGRKYWIEQNPETGKFERTICHEIGELRAVKPTIGGGLEAQKEAMQLNKESSKVKKKNVADKLFKNKKKKKKMTVKNFVIKPESTKASCSAAESIGRSIITGPRGGRYYNRRSKRSGNYYKVYCKG